MVGKRSLRGIDALFANAWAQQAKRSKSLRTSASSSTGPGDGELAVTSSGVAVKRIEQDLSRKPVNVPTGDTDTSLKPGKEEKVEERRQDSVVQHNRKGQSEDNAKGVAREASSFSSSANSTDKVLNKAKKSRKRGRKRSKVSTSNKKTSEKKSAKPREFRQIWLNENNRDEWLLFDKDENVMRCTRCTLAYPKSKATWVTSGCKTMKIGTSPALRTGSFKTNVCGKFRFLEFLELCSPLPHVFSPTCPYSCRKTKMLENVSTRRFSGKKFFDVQKFALKPELTC